MKALELKIPPPVVTALFAIAIWGISKITPQIGLDPTLRLNAALIIVGLGIAVVLSGVHSFKQAATTVNPLKPETSSALVSSGIYRFSRNPMYLGLALGLIGWTLYLAAPMGLLGVAGFVLYMNKLQIMPEERALEELFGPELEAYKSKVRRWL